MRSALIRAAGVSLLATASAQATVHNYVTNDPVLDGTTGNTAAGTVSFLQSSFDDVLQKFTWNVTFSDGVAKDTDGYWLVVSPGAMPQGTMGEFGIIYFDASTSITNPTVTVYRYNGLNDASSYLNPADLLASTLTPMQTTIMASGSESAGARTFNLMLDASTINSLYGPPTFPLWEGVTFGAEIGIWFHPTASTLTSYSGNALSFFGHLGPGGWYDGEHITTFIPSAGTGLLMGLGGLLAARRRRR